LASIDTFILIGGRSTRLGQDKAFVDFDGETLAARAGRIAREAINDTKVTFVAASEKQFDDDATTRLGASVITDERRGFGAWSGLHAALADAETDWIFVMACDQPFITPEFLKFLMEQIGDDADIVVPTQPDGRRQMLCAYYRVRTTRPIVEEILTSGNRLPPLTILSNRLRIRTVGFDEYRMMKNADRFFLNINTEADLEQLNKNISS
jgi:molybdopterin-guanine dinucleotide biosynthesis protein A